MKTIRPQTLGSLLLGLALVGQSVADELPPGLEQAIQDPGITTAPTASIDPVPTMRKAVLSIFSESISIVPRSTD